MERKGSSSLSLAILMLLPVVLAGCVGSGTQGPDGQPGLDATDSSPGDGAGPALEASYRLTGFQGGEPLIGATGNGSLWVVAHDRMIKSTDGGRSWSSSWAFAPQDNGVVPGSPRGVARNHDPMMWVDPATDRVFFAGMWPIVSCAYLAWTDDDGGSWFERGPACPLADMDHQKLVTGPPPDDAPPTAGEEYPTVAYLCYSSLALYASGEPAVDARAGYWQVRCGVSYDGGTTWPVRNVVADLQTHECATSIGAPDVGPDGTVAVPMANADICGPPRIAVSQDTGISWSMLTPPTGQAAWSDDPMVRFGPNGTLWMAYTGVDNRTHVIGTPDLGGTWTGPLDVTPPHVNSTVFNALGVGSDGRLAVAYLGTDDTDAWADDVTGNARWHLHVAAVANATTPEPTVRTLQVTPEMDPVQVGRICMSGVTCEGSRNLLDFIGGTVAPDGTFHVAYTEGCVEACAGDPNATPEDSRARETAVARLDGWPLHR